MLLPNDTTWESKVIYYRQPLYGALRISVGINGVFNPYYIHCYGQLFCYFFFAYSKPVLYQRIKRIIRAITIIVIPMMRNLLLIGTLDVVGKLITTWKISMIFSLLNISINNNIEKTIIAFANAGSISRKMMSNIIVLIMIGININTPNRFVLFHNENQAPTS